MPHSLSPLSPCAQAVLVWLVGRGSADHPLPNSAGEVVTALRDRHSKSPVYTALDTLVDTGFITQKSSWRMDGIQLTADGRTEAAAIAAAETAANAVRAGDPAPAMPARDRPTGTLPLDCLQPGGLNPRRMFDDDAIAELADSIRRAGVLQNLVVRPLPDHAVQTAAGDDPHELVAGERRWRALRLLADRGDIPADHPVPVRIVDMDDAEALMLAITENAQRADVHPLDEGEAFLALYERTATDGGDASQVATRIAEETGKTRRWVEKRIALARRLAPETRDAFRAGEITLAQAQAIGPAGPALQARAVAYIARRDPEWQTASGIWAEIRRQAVPVAHGWGIGESDYTEAGGRILDIDGEKYFDDRELFVKLQRAEISRRIEKLKEQRVFAETANHFPAWKYEPAPDDMPDADTGCIVVPPYRHDSRTHVHDRLVEIDHAARAADAEAQADEAAADENEDADIDAPDFGEAAPSAEAALPDAPLPQSMAAVATGKWSQDLHDALASAASHGDADDLAAALAGAESGEIAYMASEVRVAACLIQRRAEQETDL